MSFLTDIFSKFFKNNTAATSHLSAILDGLAAKSSDNLDWRDSIVDLMKLFGIDSSLDNREKLARQLDFRGALSDTATMNIFLQNRLMITIVENHAVDVVAILDGLAAKSPEKLDWRDSVGDLMKLFGMDSSRAAREKLARQLGYTGNFGDSAMDMSLHTRLMIKIVDNGGKLPDVGQGTTPALEGGPRASSGLTNSKRLLYTASYVTTQLTPAQQRKVESGPGGGVPKANMMRALELSPTDLTRLQEAVNVGSSTQTIPVQARLMDIAKKLAITEHPISTIELAKELAPISYDFISQFVKLTSTVKEFSEQSKFLFELTEQTRKISPIGRIHLERIEMYSAGVQKGELVFTVPMAPGETIRISHKEWSSSTREFEEIVQDYFESYSEKGVAEKSDASMSTENESKHSSDLSFGASLSGSYAGVTLTTTFGLKTTKEERESVKQSMQKSREVTEKASARTRKEHKVSVKIETKSGTEDISAKTITNPATVPIRIDYYRMMRKWRTDLFRYGLRLTYDIAIPLPGVRLWALHRRLAELDKTLRVPFAFGLNSDDLNDDNWPDKAKEFGAPIGVVPVPPNKTLNEVPPPKRIPLIPRGDADISRYDTMEFEVPEGYTLGEATKATANHTIYTDVGIPFHFEWLNGTSTTTGDPPKTTTGNLSGLLNKQSGKMAAPYGYVALGEAILQLDLEFKRTHERFKAWQRDAWAAIKASAEARYQEKLARLQEERDALWRLLNGKDTLSLRRLEREELMRLVMQWLLGPSHPVMSTLPVQTTFGQLLQNEDKFQTYTTEDIGSSLFWRFSVDDFIDLKVFVERLRRVNANQGGELPISKFVWDKIPASTRPVLILETFTSDEQKSVLVQALDKIISEGASIYEAGRFAGVVLSPETEELRKQNPTGKDLIRLNRLLLEDAFPLEIAKSPGISPTFTGISEPKWYDALLFGEFVKLIHQAVEWENLLYFLYPYFWGSETLGREKFLFEHGDPEHQRFLRAGYVRIVLPVRPGFEREFTTLVETGTLSGKLEGSSLFSVDDFIDPFFPAFVKQLRTQDDPISKFLWSKFSASTQEVLKSAMSTPEQQESALVQALNKILEGASIFDDERFNGVTLSEETKDLKSENPKGDDLIRLNRLLLEDAYKGKIAKSQHPYMPIAQEIANFAHTNYAGIPPANPELHARPLLFPEQRATWDIMQKVMEEIDAFKSDKDKYPDTLGELPSGSPLDAWGNELQYRMPGLGADYDLVSLGADNKIGGEGLDADISSAAGASLVATWFDYTPTSGLDIEVDTKPADIA